VETDTRAHGGGATVVDPVTGHLLDGRYRIGGRIARGGMASVYEALDTRLDRTLRSPRGSSARRGPRPA
jgi:hypothetical protein